jgi:hypothetical protein
MATQLSKGTTMDHSSLARLCGTCALALLLIALAGWTTARAENGVIVNGAPLDAPTARALESAYRTRLVPGRYWYDQQSGLWGLEGGPSVGLVAAGLSLAPMHPRASVGRNAGITGVYINGREIHPDELLYLRAIYGYVNRARYWLDARGIAGYEGGPAQFNVAAAARQQRAGGAGHTRRGLFGSSGSDGACSYYMHPNGSSVMTGRC